MPGVRKKGKRQIGFYFTEEERATLRYVSDELQIDMTEFVRRMIVVGKCAFGLGIAPGEIEVLERVAKGINADAWELAEELGEIGRRHRFGKGKTSFDEKGIEK